ncbi:hypothetical protein P170DRAFT_514135 [Aspergillus steynii IBT 23096]|uniref:Uncharacterized protein n=1 Tax=Aspergillus steynii IBT 23096 TaxID=1392250 RepID=A0A2I2FT63_9EURO|nr:uncharacterized protein P170DRAFT_514135 [Aspergillus steynii IBT 23096]PLB43819.1 hypothetical protein P170DRAFT_514135 [Aspergillus steynii IBT 23096]
MTRSSRGKAGFGFSTPDAIHFVLLCSLLISPSPGCSRPAIDFRPPSLFTENLLTVPSLRSTVAQPNPIPSGRSIESTRLESLRVASAAATSELHSSLRDLSIAQTPVKDIPRPTVTTNMSSNKPAASKKKPAAPVADSWEDEADDSESSPDLDSPAPDQDPATMLSPSVTAAEGPLDPPPTPISPQTSQPWVATPAYASTGPSSSTSSGARSPTRRPEKQTAVAGRMIAGALGMRAPKRTEEQRAYDRSVKEQEIRRRNREREEAAKAKEDEERAKAAVWDE